MSQEDDFMLKRVLADHPDQIGKLQDPKTGKIKSVEADEVKVVEVPKLDPVTTEPMEETIAVAKLPKDLYRDGSHGVVDKSKLTTAFFRNPEEPERSAVHELGIEMRVEYTLPSFKVNIDEVTNNAKGSAVMTIITNQGIKADQVTFSFWIIGEGKSREEMVQSCQSKLRELEKIISFPPYLVEHPDLRRAEKESYLWTPIGDVKVRNNINENSQRDVHAIVDLVVIESDSTKSMKDLIVQKKKEDLKDQQSKKPNKTKPVQQIYTVKLGDSLRKISKYFTGNPKKWKEIYYINKPPIKNKDEIYPGWVLKIPEDWPQR